MENVDVAFSMRLELWAVELDFEKLSIAHGRHLPKSVDTFETSKQLLYEVHYFCLLAHCSLISTI